MKQIGFFLATFFTISCNQQQPANKNRSDKVSFVTPATSTVLADIELTKALKAKALNGDTNAYNELSGSYADVRYYENFLYLSMSVANRFSNPQAMLDVYFCLSSTQNGEQLYNMDSTTQNLALFYLLRSYELGYSVAKFEVEKTFNGQKIPKSSFYLDNFKAQSVDP